MPELSGSRVLVTGATGFLGRRLVERLVVQGGAEVRILARTLARARALARFPIEVTVGDLRDATAVERAVRGCDVVFNCAKGLGADPKARRAVDVDGVRHVLRAGGHEGVERIVHVSTVAVLDVPRSGAYDERTPFSNSREPYVAGKREGHRVALAAAHEGLPVTIVQPTVVYGPGAGVYGRDVIDELGSSLMPLVDGGRGVCNAVYVDDVVSGLLLAATSDRAPGEAFIVSGPEPVTWRSFFGAFEAMLGVHATVSLSREEVLDHWKRSTRRPWLLAETARSLREDAALRERLLATREGNLVRRLARRVLPETFFAPERWEPRPAAAPVGRQLAAARPDVVDRLASRAVASTRKARALLGYEPVFDLEAGMRLTEEWARHEGLLERAAVT